MLRFAMLLLFVVAFVVVVCSLLLALVRCAYRNSVRFLRVQDLSLAIFRCKVPIAPTAYDIILLSVFIIYDIAGTVLDKNHFVPLK